MMADAPSPASPLPDPGGSRALPPLVLEPPRPASMGESFFCGLHMAQQRLRRRRVALVGLLGLALALASAVIERRVTSVGAVDRALLSTFRLVIPLVTLAIVTEVSSRARLSEAAWPAARFGASSRDVALGLIVGACAVSCGLAAVSAAAVVLVAASPSSPPVARDALLSAWIAAATAFAYVGWFAAGSTFQKNGRARLWPLIADFVLGGSLGFVGAILPRGNAVNLLGGPAPLGLSQAASMALLLIVGAALCLVAARRSEP
jgi:hypothetical protein